MKLNVKPPLILTTLVLLTSCSGTLSVSNPNPENRYMTCEGLRPLLTKEGKNTVCKPQFRKTCADIKNMTVVMNQLEALKDAEDMDAQFVRCSLERNGKSGSGK